MTKNNLLRSKHSYDRRTQRKHTSIKFWMRIVFYLYNRLLDSSASRHCLSLNADITTGRRKKEFNSNERDSKGAQFFTPEHVSIHTFGMNSFLLHVWLVFYCYYLLDNYYSQQSFDKSSKLVRQATRGRKSTIQIVTCFRSVFERAREPNWITGGWSNIQIFWANYFPRPLR